MLLSTGWLASASSVMLVALACVQSTSARPQNGTEYPTNFDSHDLDRRAGSFYLRILPLGASITFGVDATNPNTGNGYRKFLRDQLRYDGWQVNMVGTLSSGTMRDRDNEGWSGFIVDQVKVRAENVVPLLLPNLVLINAGTNDATQNINIPDIGERMRGLITYIFTQVPTTVVVLSTLIPNKDQAAQGNVDKINVIYRGLVKELQAAGYHIVLAEMSEGWVTESDLSDSTHPNEGGYKKMAASWRNAIGVVEKNGWLQAPSSSVAFDDSVGGTNTCEKAYGSGNQDPRGRTQVLKALSPRIIDDGKYTHSSQSMGKIHQGFYVEPDTVWFAQLVNAYGADRGGERDDWVFSQPDGIHMRLNLGGGTFGDKILIDTKSTCPQEGVRWGDVNNDGLDDFICIGPEGNMYVSLNRGGNPPQFDSVGLYKTAPSGYALTNVRLGDIDGDGRLDYCVIAGNGDIYCWRNGGQGDMAAYWQDFGEGKPVFTGKGMGNIDGVRLVDINGDFRSDWLFLDDNGKVTTYINQRNGDKGLIPYWDSVGVTHAGMGEPSRSQIRFARIYGSGRPDYVYIKCITYADKRCDYEVRAWQNTGSGGKYQKGDGAHWCDMKGGGNDDYVFIDHLGRITIFKNSNSPPNTDYSGWNDEGIVLETGLDRKALHLADWNGDGKCDVIAVTKATGAIDVWYTSYNWQTDTFSFSAKTNVVASGCTQGWGVGPFDLGMRFPDIDGDGRADYMCLEKDGRTTGWLNKATGLQWMDQIKFSVGKDRANHRWADVNGDGKDDFLWIDKFNGDTSVWYNMGAKQISGSSFWWDPRGTAYQGSSSGANLHFPNLGGVGRADMTEVNPKTALGYTWFNSCPPGGDDGAIVNPGLPLAQAPGGSGEVATTTTVAPATPTPTPTEPTRPYTSEVQCVDDGVTNRWPGYLVCHDSGGWQMSCDECLGRNGYEAATTVNGYLCHMFVENGEMTLTACPGDPAPDTLPDGSPGPIEDGIVEAFCQSVGKMPGGVPVELATWGACFMYAYLKANNALEQNTAGLISVCDVLFVGLCTYIGSDIGDIGGGGSG
ncbi:hypothetical protein VE01_09799 [Pseudogymnoascus verrucosus]|uniref:SGNH hydrolase-type esterase domain-containing protein n=1 Tax=Pseudogymnoascus verrucosus TaxID=342668 RepID=A0A1B8G9Y8_9PEZI|nr:uncharacterized protein VE01_09799 [Pseudogymnoascus verrucosus]OBT92656.2 hypothetical protein VE01_09799 [Pseudogymnoascus verrucosus]